MNDPVFFSRMRIRDTHCIRYRIICFGTISQDFITNKEIVYCATRKEKIYFASEKFDFRAKRGQQPHE